MNPLVTCSHCGKEFNKLPSQIKRSPNHFCSRSCSVSFNNHVYPKRVKVSNTCHCGKEIPAYKKICKACRVLQTMNLCRDCGTECSGLRCKECYTKSIPLRESVLCIDCGKECSGLRCKDCRKVYVRDNDLMLKDIIYLKHHKSSAYAYVRTQARAKSKRIGWNQCSKCGYSRHIEIAHIKPISSFPEDTLIKDINSEENLIPLCPNCHWEFDNPL